MPSLSSCLSRAALRCGLTLIAILLTTMRSAEAHDPTPDPILAYTFARRHLLEDDGQFALKPQFGPQLALGGPPLDDEPRDGVPVEGLRFMGLELPHLVPADAATRAALLPRREFTVAAWVTIDQATDWGGILSAIQDNGDAEQGLVLGYDQERFYVGLATEGGSDEDGTIEYLRATTRHRTGRWHHVAATYDGETLTLYVDGERAAVSTRQSGDIFWPDDFEIWIGGYRDEDESNPHHGRIGDVKLFDVCARETWVAHAYEDGADLVARAAESPPTVPLPFDAPPRMIVKPYLQWGTADAITIMWETAHACRGVVRYGEDARCTAEARESEPRTLHQVTLTGLEPDMLYYYQTLSPVESNAEGTRASDAVAANESTVATEPLTTAVASPLTTDVRTFQTAAGADDPVAFAVVCDSQAQPEVVKRVAEAMWEFRPQFVLLGGDLVTTGTNKRHWTEHYFPNMDPIASRVVVFPVLGNHEQNASYYYDYMHLPDPEYFYTFRRGNVQFFMLDSNKDVGPDSEQYVWLDKALAESDATWKVCMHHHPPFSSDDDYGNDWKRPIRSATLGDTRARQLVTLYDKHAVDVVWTGHIHSYERTWMIRGGKPVTEDGTVYMITGGAGGHLETFGPYRPAFQNRVRRGHHFCYVTSFGDTFDIKAFDDAGQLFDHAILKKPAPRPGDDGHEATAAE